MNDSPSLNLVGVQGFEPWTPWSQTRCATGLRHTPKSKILLGWRDAVNSFVIFSKLGGDNLRWFEGEFKDFFRFGKSVFVP
jgi:hypothetical protein